MLLYHFLPAKWAIDDIAKKRLRISVLDQLNDPFEVWCAVQEDRHIRQALRGFKAEMGTRFGVICFSKRWSNPLLWSHYADRHRGICLGFEVDQRGLKPVRYVTQRPILSEPATATSIEELLFTKFKDWRYEEEFRNWFRLDRLEDGHYFYPFDDFVRLRRVIVGPLSTTKRSDIEEAVGDYGPDVAIIKARLAFKTFRVVRNRLEFTD